MPSIFDLSSPSPRDDQPNAPAARAKTTRTSIFDLAIPAASATRSVNPSGGSRRSIFDIATPKRDDAGVGSGS